MENLIPVKVCSRCKSSQMFVLLWKTLTSKEYADFGTAYFS